MLQRIQSVYLAGVVISQVLMCFLPLASVPGITLSAMSVTDSSGQELKTTIPLTVALLLPSLSALITLFLYRNRKLQLKLCRLNIVLFSLIIVVVLYYAASLKTLTENPAETLVIYENGALLPAIGVVFSWLAGCAIRRDEELVQSSDRLR